MKKIFMPLLVVAFFVAFYNQGQEKPNLFVTVIAVIVFMFGMLKLSSKVPSKYQEEEEGDFEKKDTKSDFKIEDKATKNQTKKEV